MSMESVIFSLSNRSDLLKHFETLPGVHIGHAEVHHFPDQETLVTLHTPVQGKRVLFLDSLHAPDTSILPLVFAAYTANELGAKSVGLIAPYLAYMRQDKVFHSGEGVTSRYVAKILSEAFDHLITIDPHLHRVHDLSELYTIPTTVLHATKPIADWIKKQVENPLLIGPDEESEQWVAAIASEIHADYCVLTKQRFGDADVAITLPDRPFSSEQTPVLVDDLISSARTMISAVQEIVGRFNHAPRCVGVHGIFAGDSYFELLQAGAARVVSSNSIRHFGNGIDIGSLLSTALINFR